MEGGKLTSWSLVAGRGSVARIPGDKLSSGVWMEERGARCKEETRVLLLPGMVPVWKDLRSLR